MRKNRIGYVLALLILAVLLFFSSVSFLGYCILVLVAVALLSAVLLRRDARALTLTLQIRPGGQQGDEGIATIHIEARHRMMAAQRLQLQLHIHNALFREDVDIPFEVELLDGEQSFPLVFATDRCGAVQISCKEARIEGVLGIWRTVIAPFVPAGTMIYPRRLHVETELSRLTIGSTLNDSQMQNRKGNDPSEMFDIREYVPGDDIRSIHWKLSGKLDTLILRQSSEPVHYQVAFLPELALQNAQGEITGDEINTAVAVGASVCEALVRHGLTVGAVMPGTHGVYIREIASRQDMAQMMSEWLSTPVFEKSGSSLQYFMHEHMEQYFTRLLILSSGHYGPLPAGLKNSIGVTVVSTVRDLKQQKSLREGDCEIIDIPAKADAQTYYIRC